MGRVSSVCVVFALAMGIGCHPIATVHATPTDAKEAPDASKSTVSADAFAWTAEDARWVVLSRSAPLHTAPDIQSQRVQLFPNPAWNGRLQHSRSGYAMRTVGESGAWYAVETGWPRDPVDQCLRRFTGLDTFALRLYVPKTAAFFVVNTLHSLDNFEGLRRVVLPGEPVIREDSHWSLADGPNGFLISIPETHVGRTFNPHHFTAEEETAAVLCENGDLHTRRNIHMAGCDNWQDTYGLKDGATGRVDKAIVKQGCARYEKRIKRDRRKMRMQQVIIQPLFSLTGDDVLSSTNVQVGPSIGSDVPSTSIGQDASESVVRPPIQRWPVHLKAGSDIFFANGQPAGHARIEYSRTTTIQPANGKTCFDHVIGCPWKDGEAPKHCARATSRGTLRLCYATP